MATVNLDALIVREDFEVKGQGGEAPTKPSIEIRELESDQFFFSGLRKPDFQRETSEWDPKRVAGLVRTFLKDDLIPAVILWKNKDLYFAIDGSHYHIERKQDQGSSLASNAQITHPYCNTGYKEMMRSKAKVG
jgi:hypothetical protein